MSDTNDAGPKPEDVPPEGEPTLEELNEIAGAVKWKYTAFIHIPKGMWKIGAIWDQAYYEAAEYIVMGVCKSDLNPYVHGAAGVFLFRHYVELALKYVLFYSRWLEDHSKNADEIVLFKNTHDLDWLWERIKVEVPAKLGDKTTWEGFDIEFIERLVKDLHAVDPGSYGFRYNGETFGAEPKGKVGEVDIDFDALQAQMKHVYNVLHAMQVYLIETHGMNADWEQEAEGEGPD